MISLSDINLLFLILWNIMYKKMYTEFLSEYLELSEYSELTSGKNSEDIVRFGNYSKIARRKFPH
jgi:hypothetical protein